MSRILTDSWQNSPKEQIPKTEKQQKEIDQLKGKASVPNAKE